MPRIVDPKKPVRAQPKLGRPTLEDAQAIPSRIVAAATALFVELGFEATSMDLVARCANVSKRTLYARFHSKEEVFVAAVEAMSARKIGELNRLTLASRTLRTSLEEISRKLLSIVIDPAFVAMERIIAAEARRFPQLAGERAQEGLERLNAMIAAVLRKYPPFDAMKAATVDSSARIFVSMAVLPALREATFSSGSIETLDMSLIDRSVAIFIRGTAELAADGARDEAGAPHGEAAGAAPAPSAHSGRSGPGAGPGSTKERILHAAMRRFSMQSYEDAGLRDIAADVGVDVAYVHRSFGSKEALFMQALEAASQNGSLAALEGAEDLAGTIARLHRQAQARGDAAARPLVIMMRSLASPAVAPALRRRMVSDLVNPLAARLDEPRETRAAAIAAVILGFAIAAGMLQLPGLHRDNAEVEPLLAAIVAHIAAHGFA